MSSTASGRRWSAIAVAWRVSDRSGRVIDRDTSHVISQRRHQRGGRQHDVPALPHLGGVAELVGAGDDILGELVPHPP